MFKYILTTFMYECMYIRVLANATKTRGGCQISWSHHHRAEFWRFGLYACQVSDLSASAIFSPAQFTYLWNKIRFVALADLELIRQPRLAFNQESSCFSLQSAGITGLYYHISHKRFWAQIIKLTCFWTLNIINACCLKQHIETTTKTTKFWG